MSDEQTASRSIDTSIDIDAPVEALWKALADAEELTNWFPPHAEVKPGVGGFVRMSWGEGQDWSCPIDAWEPNRHLRLVYAEPTPEPEVGGDPPDLVVPFRVALDYHLETRSGGGTRLRVVQTGFSTDPSWDNQYDGTVRGWAFELGGLKHYLEHHRGTKRRVVHVKRPLDDLSLADAWQRLMSAQGLVASGALAGLGPGDRYVITTSTGDRLEGELRIVGPPKDLCATVENLNNGLLRLRLDDACFTAPQREVNVWLSLYGVTEPAVADLERRWDELLSRLFRVRGTVPP